MAASQISISINDRDLMRIDDLVKAHAFDSRSQFIAVAVAELLFRRSKANLWRECEKLDPHEEQAIAEFDMGSDLPRWPQY